MMLDALALAVAVGSMLPMADPPKPNEEITVKSIKLDLRQDKGISFPVVYTAKQNEKLRVTAVGSDKWITLAPIADATKKGFVHERALAQSNAGAPAGNFIRQIGGGNATEISGAAAAKGIEPQTAAFASARGLNTDILARLRQRRNSVDRNQFVAFTQAIRPDAN